MEDVNRQNLGMDIPCTMVTISDNHDTGDVSQLAALSTSTSQGSPSVWYMDASESFEALLAPVNPSMPCYDQFHAYDIITWHLDQTLASWKIPPLQMLIHGKGGTGKSKVIQMVMEYFTQRGVKHMLLKVAYTGIAASFIDGKTMHTIAMISNCDDNKGMTNTEMRAKLQVFWKHIQYLIIDEMLMITKRFLAKLSCNIGIGKMVKGKQPSLHSFGGTSVIKCGDFFQFPPVTCGEAEALYFPIPNVPRSQDSITGCLIYKEFTTVITPMEQMRNDAALQQHGHQRHCFIFQCHAEDTIKGQFLTLTEHYTAATWESGDKLDWKCQKQDLPNVVEVAIGMKVMVTQNMQIDLDITNRACGTVMDILLSLDETPIHDLQFIVMLKHLPACYGIHAHVRHPIHLSLPRQPAVFLHQRVPHLTRLVTGPFPFRP